MTKLQDLKLSDLLPPRIRNDEILAICASLDPELQEITAAIFEAVIMPRIMEMPEDLVDLLAWQLHVDFYEPLGLDLDKKRALVQNSLLWHMHKGTKYVLEDMIRILFFDNFKIEEWFEYDGRPFFFRLVSSDLLPNPQQLHDLIRAIYELKNERSWLDGLHFNRKVEGTIHFGIVGKRTRRTEIGGTLPGRQEIDVSTVHYGIIGKRCRTYTIEAAVIPDITTQAVYMYGISGKRTRSYTIPAKEPKPISVDAVWFSGMTAKRTREVTILATLPSGNWQADINQMEVGNGINTQ